MLRSSRHSRRWLYVPRGIRNPSFCEAFPSECARIAPPARSTAGRTVSHMHRRVVAGMCECVVHTEADPELDDLRLGELDQRSVHAKPTASRRYLRERLERAHERGAAVGIAAGIEHVDAEVEIARIE